MEFGYTMSDNQIVAKGRRPLPLYLLQSTQEKPSEAARLFDLSKHRFDHGLAC